MRDFLRSLVLGCAAVIGVAALGSCSTSDERLPGADRPVLESAGEVADRAIFAFTGVVGEGFETTLTPTETEASSTPVVEYPVSVVDPLSSPFEQGADTAVVLAGGDIFDSNIVSLERDEEYLFFAYNETQDASYSLVGIDVGAFQAQGDGSYANPLEMVIAADEVEVYAERAWMLEG